MPALRNLKDQKFGRWFVLGRSSTTGNSGQVLWDCKCDCGVTRPVQASGLVSGSSQSCGCLNREAITSHGMTGSPEYLAWQSAKSRCYNPNTENYPDYGGRGIRVCDSWLESFENFYRDMGPRLSDVHSLERREGNGDYEPNNCIWATWDTQANNRRNNVLVEIDDVWLTKSEAARCIGISKELLNLRMSKGMTIDEIMQTPVNSYQQRVFDFDGESGNLAYWAAKTGIHRDTLHYRLVVANWPIEKALERK